MRVLLIFVALVTAALISYISTLIINKPIAVGGWQDFFDYLSLPFWDPSYRKNMICKTALPFSEFFFILAFFVSLTWALYLYTGLRTKDATDRALENAVIRRAPKNPLGAIQAHSASGISNHAVASSSSEAVDSQSDQVTAESLPLSFHELAETHKEWAQLWFTITVTVFLGGLIYAVFNVGTHVCHLDAFGSPKDGPPTRDWAFWASAIIPNLFVYALFFLAWHWSARHFRAHWHNFILNAYRHRALWRYEEIQRKLLSLAAGIDMGSGEEYAGLKPTVEAIRNNVSDTLLELYRLSGVLLLLPGQSSYLEAGSDERATEQLVKLEEIVKSANPIRGGKSG